MLISSFSPAANTFQPEAECAITIFIIVIPVCVTSAEREKKIRQYLKPVKEEREVTVKLMEGKVKGEWRKDMLNRRRSSPDH